MKITNTPNIGKAQEKSKKNSANSNGQFDSLLNNISEDNSTTAAKQVTSTPQISPLVNPQGFLEQPNSDNKRSVDYGHKLLDALDTLKMELLSGTLDPHKAKQNLTNIKKGATTQDENLRSIIDEIELRIEVEIAKLL